MPYTVEYKDRGFYMTLTGLMSLEEIDVSNAIILGSEHFDDHRYQIINLLDADFSNIKLTQAKKTGAMDFSGSNSRPYVRVALVVNDEIANNFCKEYIETTKHLGSTWDFEIFNSMDSAQVWATN